ncbi:MAG TPA: hypothetical protein VEF72_10035 [Mycobacterium sp.]|nr:hypothetical protein [Mycobacterium sp.]
MNWVVETALPGTALAVNGVAMQTISALGPDILTNSKAMALLIPGVLGVFAIVVGGVWTVFKIKEGVGEAITFQLGVIVVGVLIVLSVGIAAALTDWSVDQGLVDRRYVHNEWGR